MNYEVHQDTRILNELIKKELWDEFSLQAERMHVQDIAAALEDHDTELLMDAFGKLSAETAVGVFSYLHPEHQNRVLSNLSHQQGRHLAHSLSSDDLTALLAHLGDEAESLLKLLSPSELKGAMALLGYPENSVGRLMNTEFVTIQADHTVADVLAQLRQQGMAEETINTLYVTDTQGHLLGTVSIKRLVLQEPEQRIEDLISGPVVCVQAFENREKAVYNIRHYDINSLPVLSREGIMLGVVTVDDVMDVVEQETTEDFHKMGGSGVLNLSLRDARPSLLYRKRVGWLVLLVFMNIFGGAGIAYFEETIEAVIALVFFLPLIVDSGGNAGSQSATLMVRALATGDVRSKDWFRLWGKELGVAIALGATMGVAVYGLGLWRGGSEVAMVVSLSMVLVVAFGSMIGMLLPFILTKFKLDPATASAPLITSIADICGILIYFSIATAILQIA